MSSWVIRCPCVLQGMVACLPAGFVVACSFVGLWALMPWGLLLCFLVAGLASQSFSRPPSWVEGFCMRLLQHTLVAALSMFSLVGLQVDASFHLGLVVGPSSLLQLQLMVWAMVVGCLVVVCVVGCLLVLFGLSLELY